GAWSEEHSYGGWCGEGWTPPRKGGAAPAVTSAWAAAIIIVSFIGPAPLIAMPVDVWVIDMLAWLALFVVPELLEPQPATTMARATSRLAGRCQVSSLAARIRNIWPPLVVCFEDPAAR